MLGQVAQPAQLTRVQAGGVWRDDVQDVFGGFGHEVHGTAVFIIRVGIPLAKLGDIAQGFVMIIASV